MLILYTAENDTYPTRERGWTPNSTDFSKSSLSGTALAAGETRDFVLPSPVASAVPLNKVSAIGQVLSRRDSQQIVFELPPSLTLRVSLASATGDLLATTPDEKRAVYDTHTALS